jgi:hypothetical protein
LDSGGAPGTHSFAAFGDFEYSLNCCNGQNGGSNKQTGINTVVLSGNGLTAASFQELSTGGSVNAYFAVDIFSAQTGNTGPVGAVDTPSSVPEPGSIVLLSSIAAGLFGITRRKRVA